MENAERGRGCEFFVSRCGKLLLRNAERGKIAYNWISSDPATAGSTWELFVVYALLRHMLG